VQFEGIYIAMIGAEPNLEALVDWLAREYENVSKTPLALRHALVD
jgi:hypothetical protein